MQIPRDSRPIRNCDIEFWFIRILNVHKSCQFMSQKMIFGKPVEAETVCTACKYFMESDGLFFCGFFDAFISEETLCIPCEFQEKS